MQNEDVREEMTEPSTSVFQVTTKPEATNAANTGSTKRGRKPSTGTKTKKPKGKKTGTKKRKKRTVATPSTPAMIEAAKASPVLAKVKERFTEEAARRVEERVAAGEGTRSQIEKEEKKRVTNDVRTRIFDLYMKRQLPDYRQLGFDDTTDPLELTGQIAIAQVIQAGLVAKVLLWTGDHSIHMQQPLVVDSPYIIEALDRMGYDISKMSRIQRARVADIAEQGNLARHAFARKNLGFATMMAAREKKKRELEPYTFGEVLEEAKLGVMYAVDKYDPTSGFKFSTLATWWVMQKIHSYIDERAQIIRMATSMNGVYRDIEFAKKELRTTYYDDGQITDEILYQWIHAHGRKTTLKQIRDARLLRKETISLDTYATDDGNKTIADFAESPENVESDVGNRLDAEANFQRMLSCVNDTLRRSIVRDWYRDNVTQESAIAGKLSRKYGISKEQVCELRKQGETDIRNAAMRGDISLSTLLPMG